MGKSSDEVKSSMKTTKEKITDKVADIKSNVSDTTANVVDRVSDSASNVGGKVSDTVDAISDRTSAIQKSVADKLPSIDGSPNALPLLIGSTIAGLIAGLLIPLTAIEKERLQPIGDELARAASDARSEVITQGQAVIDETVAAAKESVKAHGQEAAEHLGMSDDVNKQSQS